MIKTVIENITIIVKVIVRGDDDELRITIIKGGDKVKVDWYRYSEFVKPNLSIRDSTEILINSYLNKYGKDGYILRSVTIMHGMPNKMFYPQYTTFYLQRSKQDCVINESSQEA